MPTEAQRRAVATYRKNKVKQIVLRYYPSELELYDWCKERGASQMKTILNMVKKAELVPSKNEER